MQVDMHYYGTYAIARSAGLAPEDCRIIATAAQFVDDNAGKDTVWFQDGARLDVDATAHHTFDVANIDPEDQRKVWVPFHFIPGNEGDEYTERLLCRKNSEIAQEMVNHNVGLADKRFYLPLIGITAHVYADTFSHYGFSGVSSRKNRIDSDSLRIVNDDRLDDALREHIDEKKRRFEQRYGREGGFLPNIKRWWRSVKSEGAELGSGALGHGAVLTFPDRPYLHWEFRYENDEGEGRGGVQDRDNPATFLDAAEALHGMFTRVRLVRDVEGADDGRPWDAIVERVKAIIDRPGKKDERVGHWEEAAEGGDLFARGGERIPRYEEHDWDEQRERLAENRADSSVVLDRPVFQFYQAAAAHRVYVLRDLLPEHGLIGD